LIFGLLIFYSFNVFSSENSIYTDSLIKLGKLDQEVRSGNFDWDAGIKADKENLRKLKVLIKEYGFPTIEKVGQQAHFSAFLIAQHAVSDISFMHYYLEETKKMLGSGSVVDQTYAYLLDRTNEMADKKQVYGTQGVCVNGHYEISPVENQEELTKLRASVGLLSLKEFSKEACLGLNGH
jgi:hypothetical protein